MAVRDYARLSQHDDCMRWTVSENRVLMLQLEYAAWLSQAGMDLYWFVLQVLLSKGSGKPLGLKTLDDCLYE